MKNLISLLLVTLFSIQQVYAQTDESGCSLELLNERMAEIIGTYQESQSAASDGDESLAAIETLRGELTTLIDTCANITDASIDTESPGSGTLSDPYSFGTYGATGYGFDLRVIGLLRPADTIIRSNNMFNDRPGEGEMYVIVNLELKCDDNFNGRCEANWLDFELTGDSGTIYSVASVVYDDRFDVSTFGGGSGQGGLPFLVRADDTNLRLIYRQNMFDDEIVVFSAEPSVDNGIEISSNTNINVRSGPSTNSPVVASLNASTTVIAFGRNSDGTWLQIPDGWVFAELVTTDGDIQSLPVTQSE
jgi:hypothetical protein